MAHENIKKVEKLVDLGGNLSIWRVHLDAIREQDKNARVMPLDKFERLTANIGKDKRLESLPLCTPIRNSSGNDEFLLISGHHRTRAARAAGLTEIPIMVLDEELSHDQIRSKQLAHNALSGQDDAEMLAELYREIEDIDEKLASGLTDLEVDLDVQKMSMAEVQFNFEYEVLKILFLPVQAARFDEIVSMVGEEGKLYLADKADFERMKTAIQEISKRDNVRNIAAIVARMLDIIELYLAEHPVEQPEAANPSKPHAESKHVGRKSGGKKKPKGKAAR